MKITIRIENTYVYNEHACVEEIELEAPSTKDVVDTDSPFWDEDVYNETGCRCGEDVLPMDERVHSVYDVTVIAADDPTLVGIKYDWSD